MSQGVSSPEEVARLEQRVAELERVLRASKLHSDRFLTRAFTVWGHFIVAHLLIALVIAVAVVLLQLLVLGLFSGR